MFGEQVPCNVLVVGRHPPLLRRIVCQSLAETHENGIVVTLQPTDFYQMAPKLHIQNCYRLGFVHNLVAVRRGAPERLSGWMYVVWDGVLQGAPSDPMLRCALAKNQELRLSNIVVVAQPEAWMLPHFDRAVVASGFAAPALGIHEPVPAESYAVIDLRDLRSQHCEILPMATV